MHKRASCRLARLSIPQTHCQCTHSPQLPSTLSHHSAQLPSSCKSTALFLYHFLHIHGAFHCTVTVPKVTACCCCCTTPRPHPPICNLSDLVQAEIARNPADLHRPQGSLSIGPHSIYRMSRSSLERTGGMHQNMQTHTVCSQTPTGTYTHTLMHNSI